MEFIQIREDQSMPYRDDELVTKTFKGDVEELDARVYYTLTHVKSVQAHRNSKVLASLISLLREKEILSDDEIDELLLCCTD